MKAVAIMKGNHIVEGELSFFSNTLKFEPKIMVKKFDSIKNFDSYKLFEDYQNLIGVDMNKTDTRKFLKTMNVKKLWFYEETPLEPSSSEFNNYWFKYINPKCKTCAMKCKQSSKVAVFNCKNYKKKEK